MRRQGLRLFIHSISHFTAAYACVYALACLVPEGADAPIYTLLFSVLALGLPPLFGIIADCMSDTRAFTLVGVCLVAWGALFSSYPLVSAAAMGVGYAAFLSGGAVGILREKPYCALRQSVYIGAGLLGAAFALVSRMGVDVTEYGLAFLLLLCMALLWLVGRGAPLDFDFSKDVEYSANKLPRTGFFAAFACLLSCVAIGVMLAHTRFFGSVDWLTLLPAFLFVGAMVIAAALLRKVNAGLLAAICLVLGGAAFGLLPDALSWISCVLFGAALTCAVFGAVASMPKRTGSAVGLCSLFLLCGAMLGTFAPELVSFDIGGTTLPLGACGLMLVCALLMLFSLKQRRKKVEVLEYSSIEAPQIEASEQCTEEQCAAVQCTAVQCTAVQSTEEETAEEHTDAD